MREKQRPTERPGSGGTEETIREHPAFGALVVTRASGNRRNRELFGSRVPAASYISFALHEADEHRRLQSSTHMIGKIVAKWEMTEAQFATMVGAVGMGSGTPVTLRYRHTENFVELPAIDDFSLHEDRSRHIREMTARNMSDLRDAVGIIDAIIASKTINKTALREARSKLVQAVDNAPANYAFASKMVSDHLDETLSEIKQELHAYALATGRQIERRDAPAGEIKGEAHGE